MHSSRGVIGPFGEKSRYQAGRDADGVTGLPGFASAAPATVAAGAGTGCGEPCTDPRRAGPCGNSCPALPAAASRGAPTTAPRRQPRIRCVIRPLFHGSAAPARTQPRSCVVMPATPVGAQATERPEPTTRAVRLRSNAELAQPPKMPFPAGSARPRPCECRESHPRL
jgi:hypothetical protein